MTHHRFRTFRTAFLSALFALSLAGAAHADSTNVAGCDPNVQAMNNARAAAKRCVDDAIVDQMTPQDHSVLALSCFAKSAAVSAKKGGEIFSDKSGTSGGSGTGFKDKLKEIIDPFLKKWLGQAGTDFGNFGDAMGLNTGGSSSSSSSSSDIDSAYHDTVDSADGDSSECKAVDDVWKKEQDKGINVQVPAQVPDANLRSGDYPKTCGVNHDQECNSTNAPDFATAWDKCKNDQKVFSNYKTAFDKVNPPTIPDFSGDNSSCAVLKKAGISPDANCN